MPGPLRGAITIFGLAILFASGCKHPEGLQQTHQGKAKPTPTPRVLQVEFARIVDRDIPERIEMSGSVTADDPNIVSPQLTARVESVLVDEGDYVQQGQTLMTLDAAEQHIQIMQDDASLRQSYARLGLKPGESLKDPDKVPSVRKTLAILENKKQSYQRYVDLRRQELVSDADVANQLQEYKTAQDDYEAALLQVQQDEAAVEIAKAVVVKDQHQLKYTELRSPVSGVIQERKVSVGDIAQIGNPAFLIADVSQLYLTVAVPELNAPVVAPGKFFQATTLTSPPIKVKASISSINPILDSDTRTLSVKARILNAQPNLRPGMFVKAVLDTGKRDRFLLAPQAAVITQAGVSQVFVIESQGQKLVVKSRQVALDDPVDDWIEVEGEGVKDEDRLVTSQLAAMKDGMEVTLGKELPAPEEP